MRRFGKMWKISEWIDCELRVLRALFNIRQHQRQDFEQARPRPIVELEFPGIQFIQGIEVLEERLLATMGNVPLSVLCDLRIIFPGVTGMDLRINPSCLIAGSVVDELVLLSPGLAAVLRAIRGESNGWSGWATPLLRPASVPFLNVDCTNGSSYEIHDCGRHLIFIWKGCQFREHTFQVFDERDKAILKLARSSSGEYGMFQGPPEMCKLPTVHQEWWKQVNLVPFKSRPGLVPSVDVEGGISSAVCLKMLFR